MSNIGINPFDVLIILALLAGVVIGMLRGLVRMALSLIVLYVAAVLALTLHEPFGRWLSRGFGLPLQGSIGAAFLVIMIVASVIINFVLRRTYKETDLPGIGYIDQIGGLVIGFFVATLWIGFAVLVLGFFLSVSRAVEQATPTTTIIYFQQSVMVSMFYQFIPIALATLRPWMPQGLPPELFTTRL